MVMYDRSRSEGAQVTAEFDDCVGWIAHPDEDGQRASYALRTGEGVWLVDPLDAPNVDDIVDPLGDIVGVAVLSSWHARDAAVLARRHDVAVHAPDWMGRLDDRVDAPVERYAVGPGEAGFRTLSCRPFPGWDEAFMYHVPTATLVVPDSLGTTDLHLVGEERLGLAWFRRLQPPGQLLGLDPDRILVGHGEPVTERPAEALSEAIDGARGTIPEALVEGGPGSLRSVLGVLR
jgi:hypothetical protein